MPGLLVRVPPCPGRTGPRNGLLHRRQRPPPPLPRAGRGQDQGRPPPRCDCYPDGPWANQVARNSVADLEDHGQPCLFLVRDRGTKLTASFDAVIASAGIKVVRTPVQRLVANAFAERRVRTARGTVLTTSSSYRRQLESVLGQYVRHYNRARPHRGLHLAVPAPRGGPVTLGRSAAMTSSAGWSTSTSALPKHHAGVADDYTTWNPRAHGRFWRDHLQQRPPRPHSHRPCHSPLRRCRTANEFLGPSPVDEAQSARSLLPTCSAVLSQPASWGA
jgi:hypothetical protein